MTRRAHLLSIALLALIALVGAFWFLTSPDKARLDLSEMQGRVPKLTDIRDERFPTIVTPGIIGWKPGQTPAAAKGLGVRAFAQGLDHPRWLYELPNGDVLVAESTQPARDTKGVTDWITRKIIMKANGSVNSANRITLLRDKDGDGVAETRSVLLSGLNSPFGMALIGNRLYVANTDAVMEFPYKEGDTKITAKGIKLVDLPASFPNNHWARNIIPSPDNKSLYITVGSNSNIGEGGMDAEKGRAQISEYEFATKELTLLAYGLRNPNGLAYNPTTGTLWTTVNERDMLGSDGPPDYMTTVDFGTFYGWPYFYWGQNEDRRVEQVRPDLKQYTKRPDYALGPHVAALGLAFSKGPALGATFGNGAFVAMHGSWNRSPVSGYKVVYIPFNERGFPAENAKPVDVLTGFLDGEDKARGRPAGLILNSKGALLVADDAGNTIWHVRAASAAQ